jgi:hypothetical protein
MRWTSDINALAWLQHPRKGEITDLDAALFRYGAAVPHLSWSWGMTSPGPGWGQASDGQWYLQQWDTTGAQIRTKSSVTHAGHRPDSERARETGPENGQQLGGIGQNFQYGQEYSTTG